MKQYEMFELVFSGEALQTDWAQIDLHAEFVCGDTVKTVKGFYDGDGRYIVRFLPEIAGEWHWKVTGAVNAEGAEICQPAGSHGPVKAVETHFEYADGTLFVPIGTTVYALAHQDDALVEQTLESLKESHCGEEAYLTYFDLQCYGEQTVQLPGDKVYKAELIDVWNMTREVIAENISGETKLTLPGRDNLALLITRIQ